MPTLLRPASQALASPSPPSTRTPSRPPELSGLLTRALAAIAELEPTRRIDVTLHDAAEPLGPESTGTCDALVRVLSNACRYSDTGTRVALSSRIDRAHDGDAYLVLTVADRGIGMTPPQVQRAFDVFWRADPGRAGRATGLGLGLGIARNLVETQGGWITLRSAPGIGTEVELWLPRAAALAHARAA